MNDKIDLEKIETANVRVMSGIDDEGVTHYLAITTLNGVPHEAEGDTPLEAIENLFKEALGTTKFSYGPQAAWSPVVKRLQQRG